MISKFMEQINSYDEVQEHFDSFLGEKMFFISGEFLDDFKNKLKQIFQVKSRLKNEKLDILDTYIDKLRGSDLPKEDLVAIKQYLASFSSTKFPMEQEDNTELNLKTINEEFQTNFRDLMQAYDILKSKLLVKKSKSPSKTKLNDFKSLKKVCQQLLHIFEE